MPTSLPSLNGLRAFEVAARHASFARAAVELRMTRSAVSHRIRRLEEQLGVALFTRQPLALSGGRSLFARYQHRLLETLRGDR
jgi:LysR family transcriptional regulator, glycine cleavage system transcriptional activator